jgi:hypothetical protein
LAHVRLRTTISGVLSGRTCLRQWEVQWKSCITFEFSIDTFSLTVFHQIVWQLRKLIIFFFKNGNGEYTNPFVLPCSSI